MTVFYDLFERHAHGEGLKGHSTHYCPGCGHGLIQKYLAESIDELGVQDRTDRGLAGRLRGLHVLLPRRRQHPGGARPRARSGGGAQARQSGGDRHLLSGGRRPRLDRPRRDPLGRRTSRLPITVIFVNNAIYGMTGGQMAPTSLPGQVTATSPGGRGTFEGKPLRMAEMIAGLDGPIYVERVALYDPKQRTRARKAIRKALELQIENRGFSFVEVLAECPTHLGKTPEEAEAWVRDAMTPYFPLGVKKDLTVEPRPALPVPDYDPLRLLAAIGASTEAPPRFAKGFPDAARHARHRREVRRRRWRRRADGGDAAHPLGDPRGLRRHADPELRTGVARRHLVRRRPPRRRPRALAGGAAAAGAGGVQRPERRQVRAADRPRRHTDLRLGSDPGAAGAAPKASASSAYRSRPSPPRSASPTSRASSRWVRCRAPPVCCRRRACSTRFARR